MKRGRRELGYAWPKTAPVLAGYLVLGAAYGILMTGSGYSPLWSVLISTVVYAGSLQYLGVSLLAAGVHPVYGFFMSLMLNARHLFYGISMLEKYRNVKWYKPYLIFALTDETFSVLCSEETPPDMDRDQIYFWIAFFNHCYWILGTLLGALLGNVLTWSTEGMDFALTALFVVIFTGQWEDRGGRRFALLGMGTAFLSLLVFGEDRFLLPAMSAVFLSMLFLYQKKDRKTERGKTA